MRTLNFTLLIFGMIALMSCTEENLEIEVYETSAAGKKLELLTEFNSSKESIKISINPDEQFQKITGFGGSFTESSAYLLNKLSKANRKKVLEAYFGESGAKYSLTRTHINSCDFSLSNYSYAPIEGDKALNNFSIKEDQDDLIPMIKDAMAVSTDGFKIIASPWTAPPWMKDNNDWRGGQLLPEYKDTWSLFFSKYLAAYKAEGIDIWGITVENEPLGNNNNWESMHYSAEEMLHFVKNHLHPQLQKTHPEVKILAYDQNRDKELEEWADVIYQDEESKAVFDGFAVHWYASTYDWFPKSLQHTHKMAPEKHIIQSEACIDGQVPVWKEDSWYWSKSAKDWGFFWAPDDQKHLHPEYVPVFRYARDIIGCLNNWVDGWVDWNMVLDKQGGPNWFKNWCGAPVLVDPENDEVYLTPLYYTMAHFSRFIRPDATRIGFDNPDKDLMVSAAQNPDGSIAVVILNMEEEAKNIQLTLGKKTTEIQIDAKALQTVIIK